MKNYLLFFLFSIFSFKIASAQHLNFKTGDEFTVKTTNTETIAPQRNEHQEYTFLVKVLSADSGMYKLQCKLSRFELNSKSSYYSVSINTDSIKRTEFNSNAMLAQLILLQNNFTVVLNNKGAILNIKGHDELIQDAIKKWSLSPQSQEAALNNTKVFITNAFKKIFFELPQKSMAFKSNWNKYETDFIVDRHQGNLIQISASNASKSFTGKYVLNAEIGMPVKATVSQKDKDGKVLMAGNYSQVITNRKVNVTQVDTAWINMAISMSFMSDRFKNRNGNGDSAKVFSYLRAHNKIFKNDPYYNRNRLSLIQTVETRSAYRLYDSLLNATPNHFLAGNITALTNKNNRALENSADSAYQIIKYYYQDRLFNNWIQYSYAQSFVTPTGADENSMKTEMLKRGLSENEINKTLSNIRRAKQNAYLLLEKLRNDKTSLIQQKTKPLYLWVTALKDAKNAQTLNNVAAQFAKLDDNYMKEGNGGRHGLLLYKIFTEAGDRDNANLIMKKVINDLTNYQADTLYGDRLVARNLLAHAYYVSYQDALSTDSVSALEYLLKAALYSPSSAREKAYGSFYDRVFLNSKESYADDYVKKLFEKGDSDGAMTVFAQYISADLEHLTQAQALFEKHFPNKSFKAFFADKVVSGWATAPDFSLKGADNSKEYALSGYNGKWLLADFWGTWCGPCREEMPEVNKFNNTLMEGKLSGWAFLSIACMDNTAAVNKYLADNKYGIPVAMADAKITNNYKITGYPSKILISPTGKMISTSFGADWRGIIAKVNELYPAQ